MQGQQGYLVMEDRGETRRGQRWGTPGTPSARSRQIPPRSGSITPRSLIAVDKAALGISADWRERITLKSSPRRKESSVRVVARFRPPSSQELENEGVAGDQVFKVCEDGRHVQTADGSQSWEFDVAFGEECTQEDVYEATGRPVIDGLLDGYNGTIFAYGQTGSGKTHCMFGPTHDFMYQATENRGIVPRAVQHVFNHIHNGTDGTEFVLRCSLFEVYREQLRDLLEPTNATLRIKETPRQGVFVDGLAQEFVASEEDVVRIIRGGSRLRAVAATCLNQHSSRSHVVFSLTCEQRLGDGTEKLAKLNLVDLAGSEKVWKSNSSGVTLEEAKKINWSLSALGNVINALAARQGHVPYRNSKLTRILQETLGGNFKTALVTTCSPLRMHLDETFSSLQFATRAKSVCNHVKVNFVYSAEQLMAFVERLQQDLLTTNQAIAASVGGITPTCLAKASTKTDSSQSSVASEMVPRTHRLPRWDANLLDESCEDTCVTSPASGVHESQTNLLSLAEEVRNSLCEALQQQEDLMTDISSLWANSGGTQVEPLDRWKAQQCVQYHVVNERRLKRKFDKSCMNRREMQERRRDLENRRRYLDGLKAEVELELQREAHEALAETRGSPGSSPAHSPRERRPSFANELSGATRGDLVNAVEAGVTGRARESPRSKESRRRSHGGGGSKEFVNRVSQSSSSTSGALRRNHATLAGIVPHKSDGSYGGNIFTDLRQIEKLKHEKQMIELDFEREDQMRQLKWAQDNERWRHAYQIRVDEINKKEQFEDQANRERVRLEELLDQRRAELAKTHERIRELKRENWLKEYESNAMAYLKAQQEDAFSKAEAADEEQMARRCADFVAALQGYAGNGLHEGEVPWARQGA